jgi:hypothetical protein
VRVTVLLGAVVAVCAGVAGAAPLGQMVEYSAPATSGSATELVLSVGPRRRG